MTGHEPTVSKPQLADLGEQLQREFAGRLLGDEREFGRSNLSLSDDWWSVSMRLRMRCDFCISR